MTGYGGADKAQVGRMVAVCLSLAEVPRPDDTPDALAIAIWAANAERPGVERRSSVLDRAAVDPIEKSGNGARQRRRDQLRARREGSHRARGLGQANLLPTRLTP